MEIKDLTTPHEEVQTTETPSIESQSTETPAATTAGTEPSQGASAAEEAAWSPDYKVKFLNQEKEMDEWVRPLVNKENEAKIRELYEKAYGLDYVKPKYETEKKTREKLETEYNTMHSFYNELVDLRDNGDFGLFLERAAVDPKKLINWVVDQLKREELPEDQKKVYNNFDATQRELYNLRQENQRLLATANNTSTKAMADSLNVALAKPEIAPIASSFDARQGQGAFWDFVVDYANNKLQRSGVNLTPEQAVSEVINILGNTPQGNANPTPNAAPNQNAPKVVKDSKPVVIPNVGSGSSSAMSKKARSVEDLRQKHRELVGAG